MCLNLELLPRVRLAVHRQIPRAQWLRPVRVHLEVVLLQVRQVRVYRATIGLGTHTLHPVLPALGCHTNGLDEISTLRLMQTTVSTKRSYVLEAADLFLYYEINEAIVRMRNRKLQQVTAPGCHQRMTRRQRGSVRTLTHTASCPR